MSNTFIGTMETGSCLPILCEHEDVNSNYYATNSIQRNIEQSDLTVTCQAPFTNSSGGSTTQRGCSYNIGGNGYNKVFTGESCVMLEDGTANTFDTCTDQESSTGLDLIAHAILQVVQMEVLMYQPAQVFRKCDGVLPW